MTLALEAARQGIRGANPLVGAVITGDAHGHVRTWATTEMQAGTRTPADALAAACGTDLSAPVCP